MSRWIVIVVMLLPAGLALAEDGPNPEQLKKMYNDALVQLRSAQDRKNELANENESLKTKIAELSKRLDGMQSDLAQLRAETSKFAEQTFAMRARLAAWNQFLQRDGKIAARWDVFIENTVPTLSSAETILDRDWPLSALDQKRPARDAAKLGATSGA